LVTAGYTLLPLAEHSASVMPTTEELRRKDCCCARAQGR
jgi:hypothetical protein